jgi:hypothetical protein
MQLTIGPVTLYAHMLQKTGPGGPCQNLARGGQNLDLAPHGKMKEVASYNRQLAYNVVLCMSKTRHRGWAAL